LKERSCDCGRKVKKKYLKGNNWVCYYCYQKQFTRIPGQDKKCTSLDDAVKKIRKVRSYTLLSFIPLFFTITILACAIMIVI